MSPKYLKIAFLTCVFAALLCSNGHAQDIRDDKHIEVSLRMIGHQILLNAGDSTSLVLPIVKENDQYRIQFEAEFGFNPDELVNTANRVIQETKMAQGYFVEVERCETGEVVYSYEMSDFEELKVIPCKSRDQPKSCYSVVFTLIRPRVTPAPSNPESTNEAKIGTNWGFYGTLAILLIGGLAFLVWKRRRGVSIDPNLIPIGKYNFDKRKSELSFEEQKIELSSKEADLLILLHNSANTTVEREVILNVVWGDEGDYIGRTLDVFISKLRKKLEADLSVKIVNIRGVGYKLLID
jgi:hypothetical protein